MSDTLAILDAAVARVSALLVPDSLSTLVAFLRGDPCDSCDTGPSQSSPNLLVSLYEFLPLAIAPHVSLMAVSAAGERSALAQHFERCGFRVFSLNLSPIARQDCVDALRLWCATDTHETAANRKRSRSGAHNTEALRCALCIVHCGAGNGTRVGNSKPGGSASRPRNALLHLFLHDIAALSALCRARRALHRSWAVRLSVLLVPSDHAHGASLLEEELRDGFGSLFCVRLFNPHRATASDECGDAFRREVAAWLAAPADVSAWLRDSSLFFVRRDNLPLCCFLREAVRRFPIILAPAALRLLQALWAARRQLSDCAAGLHAILSPYTCSSSSSSFSFCFSSCCARGANGTEGENPAPDPMAQLRDAAHVINALLDAAERWAGGHATNAAVAFAVLYEDAVWQRPARLERVPSVVEALRRIWCRNRRHSEGEQSSGNSGSGGRRRRRRSGSTTTTTHTEEGKEEKEKEKEEEVVWSVRAALATCVPVHQSRFPLSLGHDSQASQQFVDSSRDVVAIPQILAVPSARVSVSGELLSAALLAVVPPQESLDALKGRAAITTSNSNNCAHTMDSVHDNHHDHHEGEDNDDDGGGGGYMALNNFFSPWVPDSVRLLHVLATHAVGQTSARQKFLSLAVLQRVCQMSDEALLRALKELQLAGMVTVNGREMKARTLLEV